MSGILLTEKTINLPIEKVDTYQVRTPGMPKRIQVFDIVGHIPIKIPVDFPDDEIQKIEKTLYIGIGLIYIANENGMSTQDIPFPIPDALSIEDAFNRFDGEWKKVEEKLNKDFGGSNIQIASEDDLNVIDKFKNFNER